VESNEPNEREKKLAQKIFDELFKRFTAVFLDAKLGITEATDQAECVIYQALAAYRAELTAPAGGDVETVDKLVRRFYKIPDGEELADWAYKLRNEITAALHVAQQVERSKVPPPDEIHRDGYNKGVEAERERWEAAARKYRRIYKAARRVLKSWEEDGPGGLTDITITGELKDAITALLAGEEAKSGK